MTLFDFIVLTLAASAVVDVWRNGSIFADWRAFFEDKASEPVDASNSLAAPDDDEGDPLPFTMQVADKVIPCLVAELLTCWFCFSHHTPWVLALVCFFPAFFVQQDWLVFLLKLPVYSFAATRLGTIINAILPIDARYTRE